MVTHVHVGPGQNLQLARFHHPLNVYSCLGQSLQVIFPILGSHDVRSLFTPIEAILVERAQHSVLLVQPVEERANVSVRSDVRTSTLQGSTVRRHLSPLLSTAIAQSRRTGLLSVRLASAPVN